ncbi:MAG TPA: class D sortase [Gaiellaceae bacterium]|nr:class D sortase [Gaiellaceae bacterium]
MRRKIGYVLLVGGICLLAWVGATLTWGDPVTSIYTSYEQRGLSQRLDTLQHEWAARAQRDAAIRSSNTVLENAKAARRARVSAFAAGLREGQPIGRISIPRLQLSIVVVQGTSESNLEKGPGHYDAASGANTSLPGLGGVVGIAGHRTTYAHPFRHIDDLKAGDRITLTMPYGTFRYTVYAHKIVGDHDWSILRKTSFEKLVLSACHPLYSATHRWVVFARLTGSTSLDPAA